MIQIIDRIDDANYMGYDTDTGLYVGYGADYMNRIILDRKMRDLDNAVQSNGSKNAHCAALILPPDVDTVRAVYNGIVARCKGYDYLKRYKGCTLCKEWADKDLRIMGNKRYSPTTCMLLPRYINTLLVWGNKNQIQCVADMWRDYLPPVVYNAICRYTGYYTIVDDDGIMYRNSNRRAYHRNRQLLIDNGYIEAV